MKNPRMPIAVLLAAAPLLADPAVLVCTPSTPIAAVGSDVTLTASSDQPNPAYMWTASTGAIVGNIWNLKGAEVGPQTADLELKIGGKVAGRCSVEVRVVRSLDVAAAFRGDPERTTARALLDPSQTEAAGFGLYSYLLFGAAPQEAEKDRYRKILEACLRLMPATMELQKYLPANRLNSMFIPVGAAAQPSVDAGWLLDHYDYARARALLTRVPGARATGVYIVSASAPLLGQKTAGPYLVQDLSAIPGNLVSTWVAAFINQAAQERYWEPKTSAELVLKLRLSLAILAEGVPQVKTAVAQWISIKS